MVRRKALLVVPTICNKCGKPFLDKVYDVGKHVVKCTHCDKVNAVTNYPTMESIQEQADAYDVGLMGQYGIPRNVERPKFEKKKKEKKDQYSKLYNQLKNAKLKEIKKDDKKRNNKKRNN